MINMNFDLVKKQHPLVEQDVICAHLLEWEKVHKDWWHGFDSNQKNSVLVYNDGTVFYQELDWGCGDESVPNLSNELLEQLLEESSI